MLESIVLKDMTCALGYIIIFPHNDEKEQHCHLLLNQLSSVVLAIGTQ